MVDALAWLIVVVLCVWFVLSALVQASTAFPKLGELRRWDLLGLLPHYHFFCPNPVRNDFHLLSRTRPQVDGEPGAWREMMGPPRRAWWNAVWNPDRRAYKSLCDLMEIVAEREHEQSRAAQLSIPYLALLNHVTASAVAQGDTARYVQLLLAISVAGTDPQAVFMSAWHRTPGGTP